MHREQVAYVAAYDAIGPLRRRLSRYLTRIVANRAAQITVRDPASAELLRQIGVRRPPVEVTADPAFALTSAAAERVAEIRERAGIHPDRPAVGVALRPWRADRAGMSARELARMCDLIAEDAGAQIVFIPMQPPGDVNIASDIVAVMNHGDAARLVTEPLQPREAMGLIGSLDGLVAMRLHALIFAAAFHRPIAALSYDPKVTQLMEGLGQSEYNVELPSFSPERAAELMAQGMASRVSLQILGDRADEMARKALINVDLALAAAR